MGTAGAAAPRRAGRGEGLWREIRTRARRRRSEGPRPGRGRASGWSAGETASDWSAPRGRPLRRRETGTRKARPRGCVGPGLRLSRRPCRFSPPRRARFRRLRLLTPARPPRALHGPPARHPFRGTPGPLPLEPRARAWRDPCRAAAAAAAPASLLSVDRVGAVRLLPSRLLPVTSSNIRKNKTFQYVLQTFIKYRIAQIQ